MGTWGHMVSFYSRGAGDYNNQPRGQPAMSAHLNPPKTLEAKAQVSVPGRQYSACTAACRSWEGTTTHDSLDGTPGSSTWGLPQTVAQAPATLAGFNLHPSAVINHNSEHNNSVSFLRPSRKWSNLRVFQGTLNSDVGVRKDSGLLWTAFLTLQEIFEVLPQSL